MAQPRHMLWSCILQISTMIRMGLEGNDFILNKLLLAEISRMVLAEELAMISIFTSESRDGR
jgi:hypothetical protein